MYTYFVCLWGFFLMARDKQQLKPAAAADAGCCRVEAVAACSLAGCLGGWAGGLACVE